MQNIKGFVGVNHFTNNEANTVALVGELSPLSRTYSKDRLLLSNTTRPEISLIVFHNEETISSVQQVKMEDVARWVIEQGEYKNSASSLPTYISDIQTQFPDNAPTINVGELVSFDGGYYPSYVSFEYDDWQFRLWFADQAFQTQYDEYAISVIAPLEDVDSLFGTYDQVKPLVDAVTPAHMITRLQEVISQTSPDTAMAAYEYIWQDYTDASKTFAISISISVHGSQGLDADNVREAISSYILANSSHTKDEWSKVLPEIFSPDEFMIVPHWDAVIDVFNSLDDDIYSSIIKPDRISELAWQFMSSEYTLEHVSANVEYLPTMWRGIGLSVCGNPKVDEDKSPVFSENFTDHILTSTTTADFGRMSQETQAVVLLIAELLTIAETLTEFTALETGFYRVERGNSVYIAKALNRVTYMVLSKESYMAETVID